MRVLIDILHPAHVHVFRNFRSEMLERGHEVLVTSRVKDVTVDLLEAYDIPHSVLSSQGSGRFGLARELAVRTARLVKVARHFKPDVMIGIMGPAIALAGKLLRIPSVVMYDTEFAPSNRWVFPLATVVVTPEAFSAPVNGNHVTYPGFHEMAYLHPNRFTPDRGVLDELGIDTPYSLVRFVSWTASHDIGESGLALDKKRDVVQRLQARGSVFITSESPLPADLEGHRLVVPVHKIHHVMSFAECVVGESPTMASEAALLGVTSILISPFSAGVLREQSQSGMITHLRPSSANVHPHQNHRGPSDGNRAVNTRDELDLTDWMVEFVEGSAPCAYNSRAEFPSATSPNETALDGNDGG